MSRYFNDVNILRRLAAILTVSIIGVFNLFEMCMCASSFLQSALNTSTAQNSSHAIMFNSDYGVSVDKTRTNENFESAVCTMYPSYYSNYAILILIATSMVSQLTHICKFCLMLIIAGNYTIYTYTLLCFK